ncbi:hypothetical protein CMUS01_07766 [Colletotrichum musicola]|uniref:Large ribosomal subunit protein mL50 n=1 Tax=Colletotrichum musicola TaxID=2175873 RepID=A0A8H6NEB9_9PEZI|nr:hypothetical protein CMUS01_07766 [Colletotrichum musicola]
MRRISRLRPAAALAPQCSSCSAAPATLPISLRAAAPLSTTSASSLDLRSLFGGKKKQDADPTKIDPADADALHKAKQDRLAADLAEAEKELAEFNASQRAAAEDSTADAATPTIRKQQPKARIVAAPQRKKAPTPEEAKELGYEPANTADGLEEIGGVEGWWDRPGNWHDVNKVPPFSLRAPAERITDGETLGMLVRQAVFEVLTRSSARRDVKNSGRWIFDLGALELARDMRVKIGEDGSPLLLDSQGKPARADLVRKAGQPGHSRPVVSPKTVAKVLGNIPAEDQWKEVSLQDPLFRFAVAKRLFHISGYRVHDAKLMQCQTAGELARAIAARPKPAKVAEAVRRDGALLRLPNLQVFDRRVTPIDKEKAVGRWKVIEAELEKRSLPVTGHKHLQKGVERKWILGKA